MIKLISLIFFKFQPWVWNLKMLHSVVIHREDSDLIR